jgi:hypothetical protein
MRRVFSLAHKRNISLAQKGRIPWNAGKSGVYSVETRMKMRIAKLKPKELHKSRADSNRDYRAQNIEKARFWALQRHRRLKGAQGTHTLEEWEELKAKFDYRCVCCLKTGLKLTEDHIRPLSKGGSNDISNIQPLCISCNSEKRVKVWDLREIYLAYPARLRLLVSTFSH